MFALSQVVINISGRGLKTCKTRSGQYSTRCTVLISNGENADFVEIDNTEVSDDYLNPDWHKKFTIAFKFHGIQTLRFDVYRSLKLGNNQQKIGESKISFAELVTAKDGFTMKSIKSEKGKMGKLLISVKEVESSKETVVMQLNGKSLDKKDIFGQSDPYLIISKLDRNGDLTEVYRSEIIKGTLTPVWLPIKIRVKTLCDSDRQMKLQFDCYDWDRNTEDELIGTFNTTLEQLLTGPSDANNYGIINPNKLVENFKSYSNSGIISLDSIRIIEEKSFLDYLRSGARFHLKISLDFSSLLEYYNSEQNTGNKANIYQLIIKSFGDIIKQYDYERLLTASGLGAVFPDNQSNDYYELNKDNKYYDNIEHLIEDYESLLKLVKPLPKRRSYKVVNFEPTINQTLEWMEQILKNESNNKLDYFILLLMTSEVNTEMLKNFDAIINKTYSKPISIVIIDSKNSNEQIEDIINGMVRKKRVNSRNNIQYISTLNFYTQQSVDWHKLVDKLVRDILNRIPDQYFEYLQLNPQQTG